MRFFFYSMSHPHEIITLLENTSSRTQKEAILSRAAVDNNIELFTGLNWCYNSYVTFGVKNVPKHQGTTPTVPGTWSDFERLLKLLATRASSGCSGSTAKLEIEKTSCLFTADEWDSWYRRILIRDMRAGFTDNTVNKVLAKFQTPELIDLRIPVFDCMLAKDGSERSPTGKRQLEIKLDGVRVLTVINIETSSVTMCSRNGKILDNFTKIRTQFETALPQFTESVVIDGEIMGSSFQALMTQLNRTSGVNTNSNKLMIFDIIPLDEFMKGEGTVKQSDRSATLQNEQMTAIFETVNSDGIVVEVINPITVDLDTTEGVATYKQFNKDAIDNGLEGIMIKDPDAVYKCKRTDSWLKLKPVITVDLTIVSLNEGTGKNEGMLGAFGLEGEVDGKRVQVDVGSGLTDDQRREFWESAPIGYIAEIEADGLTLSQDSTDVYSLRFPRFVRLRGTEPGEKL